jgi:GNAT superfamily N-acetyltransferase
VTIGVRRLRPDDDRTDFRSGNIELDRFFARYAGQNQFRHHIGTTYVAVDGSAIVGFATVAASELTCSKLALAALKRLPSYPLPVLRLARLAVDQRAQGRGVGQVLLRAVFALARKMADELGCLGVVVDAKPEAVEFYHKLGFIELEARAGLLGDRPQPVAMFIELGAVAKDV